MLKKALLIAALAAPLACLAAFPEKPVRIIVGQPAGGPVDVILRLLANRLSTVWGQAVVVDNKPGASGIIGGFTRPSTWRRGGGRASASRNSPGWPRTRLESTKLSA